MSDESYQSQESNIRGHLNRPTSEPSALVQKIDKAEGTGKNPLSTAVGTGQFINSTMLAKFKQWYPERARGMTDQQILNLRTTDRPLMLEMTEKYAEENEEALRRARLPTTPGNIYLAHHFGPTGARTILRASPGSRVREVLDDEVIKANPHLKYMSIAQLIKWASNKAN